MRVGSLVLRAAAVPARASLVMLAVPALARQAAEEGARALEGGRAAVRRAALLLDAVEVLVAEIALTSDRATVVAASAEAGAVRASVAVTSAETQAARVEALLDGYAPALAELQPVVRTAGDSLRPRHVAAVVQLLELAPEAVDLIVPALRGMGDLTPELNQLAERFDAVGAIVEGIPGAGLLRRRGAESETEA